MKVKLFVVPPGQGEDECQEEAEREDECPGPDQGEHEGSAPWLGAVRGGVAPAGPGAPIELSVGGSEEAGVTAGVSTLPLLQAAVTLLALLHHGVATETRAPVVLLR